MHCIALWHRQKLGLILQNNVVKKLKSPKLVFPIEKKCIQIWMIFDKENSHFKSDLALFDKAAKVAKASDDAYNLGGRLIL